MSYVNKQIAFQYLAGSEKLFNNLKNSFIKSYKNADIELKRLYEEEDFSSIHRIIHTIKGISLNIGSQVLYDDCCYTLLEYNKGGTFSFPKVLQFIETLQMVIKELETL